MLDRTAAAAATERTSTGWAREKSSTCRIVDEMRSICWMIASSARLPSACCSWSSSSSARARMIPSGVPTSWAMPAASTPVVASFSARVSWSSSDRTASAVRSRSARAAATRCWRTMSAPTSPIAATRPTPVNSSWRASAFSRVWIMPADVTSRTRQLPSAGDPKLTHAAAASCRGKPNASAVRSPTQAVPLGRPSSLRSSGVRALAGRSTHCAPPTPQPVHSAPPGSVTRMRPSGTERIADCSSRGASIEMTTVSSSTGNR